MMNTFILVGIIPPHVRDSLKDKSMLAPSNKRLYFSQESYQGIFYSHKHSKKGMVNTLLIVNITPVNKARKEHPLVK